MWVHRYRDERLPKGPRFASESLDADTGSRSVSWKLTYYSFFLSGLEWQVYQEYAVPGRFNRTHGRQVSQAYAGNAFNKAVPSQGNNLSILIGSPYGITCSAAARFAVLQALINPIAGSAGK